MTGGAADRPQPADGRHSISAALAVRSWSADPFGSQPVLIDGDKDTGRSSGDGARFAERLIRAGATGSHHVVPVGHSITTLDRVIDYNDDDCRATRVPLDGIRGFARR
jgi:hypothetical protein